MGNFYKDNDDIRFLFQHLETRALAGLKRVPLRRGIRLRPERWR